MSFKLARTDTDPRAAEAPLEQRRAPWRARRRGAALTLLAVSLSASLSLRQASAQEDPQALAARALFDEGRRLMEAGELQAACEKLEESQNLRSGLGTQFNLASCYESTGRIASAWSLYRRVAAETRSLGQLERERVAREHADALEERLSYLTLDVQTPVEGLTVRLDEAEMSPATWGVATPIDPGEHVVVAQAPGRQRWQGTATIPDVAERVVLAVPSLKAAASIPDAEAEPSPDRGPANPATEGSSSGFRLRPPWIVGLAGGASIAVSGVLGLSFLKKNGEAKDVCSGPGEQVRCSTDDIDRHDQLLRDARGARGAGFALLGLGVAAVGVSVVWLLVEDDGEEPTAVEVRSRVGSDSVGLSLSSRF